MNMLYNIFGNYSQMTGDGVQLLLLREVGSSLQSFEQYECAVYICLKMKEISLEYWLTRQTHHMICGDEIAVYVLSKLYNRHTMIHTAKKTWCTILPVGCNVNYAAACHTLLFMGNHMYGELHPKPLPQLALQLLPPPSELPPQKTIMIPTINPMLVSATNPLKEEVAQPVATTQVLPSSYTEHNKPNTLGPPEVEGQVGTTVNIISD